MSVRDLVVSISFVVDNKTLEAVDRKVTQIAKDLEVLKGIGTKSFDGVTKSTMKTTKEISKTTGAVSRLSSGFSKVSHGFTTLKTKTQSAFRSMSQGFSTMTKNLESFSKKTRDIGSSITSRITKPITGAVTAASGLVATLGFGRLIGMDEAQAKLRGLGYEGEIVGKILKDVENAVQGTAFTMAEGTNVAAGALAAGVQQGKELERYIRLVGSAAAGSNSTMGEMALIFNRIQGTGRLMTGELNMIEDRLPGFSQAMAKHLGVSLEQFRDMVSDGQVTSKQFLDVMESFAGGMATAMADTWSGMAKNIRSNIGIIGQNILEGLFMDTKEGMADLLETLRSPELREWAKEFGKDLRETVHNIIGYLKDLKAQWNALDPSVKENIKRIAIYGGIALAVFGPILSVMGVFMAGLVNALKGIGFMLKTVGLLFTGLWKTLTWGWKAITFIVKGLNLMRMFFVARLIPAIFMAIKAFSTFTVTLLANPFTWIAAAIIGVALAVIYLWQNWDQVSAWLAKSWDWIRTKASEIFSSISNWIQTKMDEARNWISNTWNNILEFLRSIDLVQVGKDIISGLVKGIKSMGSELWASVTEVASTIKNRFKSFFGISSPAKLTMDMGADIGEGLKIGLDKSVLRVAQTAQNLARAANPAPRYTPERPVRSQPVAASGPSINQFAPNITVYISGNATPEQSREVETNLKRKVRKWWQEFQREAAMREV